MNGDLSLSQSFGGLRIANPDHRSPNSNDEQSYLTNSVPSPNTTASPPLSASYSHSPFQVEPSNRSISPLGFDPSTYSVASIPSEQSPLSPSRATIPPQRNQSQYPQRHSSQPSIPPTYQAQQQAQFPQYPTVIPRNQRLPGASSHPSSIQHPRSSSNGYGTPQDGSYRVRSESSQSSKSALLRRANSRGASAAMQAGVPSREDEHSDRSYRQTYQPNTGNGTTPPRKTSQGTAGPLSDAQIDGIPINSSEEWRERGAAVGIRKEIGPDGKIVSKYVKKAVEDFTYGRTLGEGSYSTVVAATDRHSSIEYAMKILDKRHIIKEKKVKYVNIEKDTLNRLTDHPGVVRLYYTFQDEHSLFFALDLCTNGELLGVLKRMTTFDEECTQFYGAQILDTIDYMHMRGVIHRDLKPENVLLDDKMHIKITDFGTAKILDLPKKPPNEKSDSTAGNPLDGSHDNRANSFVGTAEYVSPELLNERNACKASDLWAFGCIIYQLLAGRPPFKAGNEFLTFQKITALDYQFPEGFPELAKDLVERLLVLDPSQRLTIEHIKNHSFFRGISWGRGLWKQKAPKLKSYTPGSSGSHGINGHGLSNGNGNNYPSNFTPSHSTKAAYIGGGSANNNAGRPAPRVITELPPPSQLDIDWSPVLTRNNERILKLGNLLVLSAPAPHSPNGKTGGQNSDANTGNRFSRLFGGNAPKKRQQLVMVTSSARVIMAASGGDKKKTEIEISLLNAGCAWRKCQDPKGLTFWCIDTREKHFTFEDPRAATSDGSATLAAAQEWLDAIERARDIAISQSMTGSYSGDEAFKILQSGANSSTDLNEDSRLEGRIEGSPTSTGRNTLQKSYPSPDAESTKGRKRFSKRQSRSGLAAVF